MTIMNRGNSFIRITAMAGKEWLQIRRDSRSLILALAAPALLIMLFGYALNMDVKNISTALIDRDMTPFSRSFTEKFSNTEYLRVMRVTDSGTGIDDLINSGTAALAIIIPDGCQRDHKTGKGCAVQVIADGSDSTSATVAMGYVKSIISSFNMLTLEQNLKRAGVSRVEPPVKIESRVWYNPELESKNYIVPGLIVLVLAIISALIASMAISREWERGTMETLITTPVRPAEVIIGKMIPYLFIGLFDVLLAVLTGHFLFGIEVRGSFTELYLLSLLFLIGTTAMGLLISSATKVQVLSVQAAMVATYLPSFILSGFIFPIQNMPLFVQGITYLVPAKYLIGIIKGISMKGVGAGMLKMQILFLLVFTVFVTAAAVRKLKLKIPE
jgi:ABC-2 type transport system permease protein